VDDRYVKHYGCGNKEVIITEFSSYSVIHPLVEWWRIKDDFCSQ